MVSELMIVLMVEIEFISLGIVLKACLTVLTSLDKT